jgi:hypothetical protein
VTDKDQGRALTEQEKYLHDNFLDALWESFCLTGNPADLAKFVRFGGALDNDEKRNIVADFLEKTPFNNPGGAKPMEFVEFYLGVLRLMTYGQRDDESPDEATDEDGNAVDLLFEKLAAMSTPKAKGKPMGKTEAIEYLADKRCIAHRTGWDQYKAGEKLLGN